MNPPMTALVEREQIARAIFEATPDRFMRVEQCYPAADAILALRQLGAEYRLDERAFVSAMDARLKAAYRQNGGIAAIARRSSGAAFIRNTAILEAIEALRALSDSIPDTKGGRDGE